MDSSKDIIVNDETPNQNMAKVDDSSVTMVDVLNQEREMEEEYAAVLGASDENCCTYSQGAVKRQALYSCITCCPEARNNFDKAGGICLACSYNCHENHELVELYTKRKFRCDCPTERMSGNRCHLNPALGTVQPANVCNVYNQNFQGLYCTCHRPYPDPDSTTEDIMIQCAICEDWFHSQHLEVPSEALKLVEMCSEMICDSCMQCHAFLRDYTELAQKALEEIDNESANNSVTKEVLLCEDNDNKLRSDLDKSISEIMKIGEDGSAPNAEMVVTGNLEVDEPKCKRPKLEKNDTSQDEIEVQKVKCCRPTGTTEYKKGATFWGRDWRLLLCRCVTCFEMYKSQKVTFLLEADDSAKSYEERGIKRAASEASTYEQGIRALASIGRVQQIDAITEYNRMKDRLKEFLQTFAVSKRVVTEEDINRFFQEMRNEKNASLGQPYFCR